MIITYLKHKIYVDSTERCAAHVVVDGVRRCFLGGIEEAKRFLRDRKHGPYYGPRRAIYAVMEVDVARVRTRELSSMSTRTAADSDLASYRADASRPPTFVRRTEGCPVPGCDGHGEIREQVQRSWVTRPCPCHVESIVCDDRAAELEI